MKTVKMQRALEVCIKSPSGTAGRVAWSNEEETKDDFIVLVHGGLWKFRGQKKLGKYNPTPIDVLAKDWVYQY